jgi:hypothetical protein
MIIEAPKPAEQLLASQEGLSPMESVNYVCSTCTTLLEIILQWNKNWPSIAQNKQDWLRISVRFVVHFTSYFIISRDIRPMKCCCMLQRFWTVTLLNKVMSIKVPEVQQLKGREQKRISSLWGASCCIILSHSINIPTIATETFVTLI